MSENEKQLVIKVAKHILAKVMNSNQEIIDYHTVEKEMDIPMSIIKSAATNICKMLMTSKRVEDVDILDGDSFEVLLYKEIRV